MTSSRLRIVLLLGVLGASACSSVLGLDEFGPGGEGGQASSSTGAQPTSASNGASTSDGATSTNVGSSSGGSQGGGGSGPAGSTSTGGDAGGGGAGGGSIECTALDPFEVFSTLELSSALGDETILVAQRPPNENRVHVAVPNQEGQIFARTVRNAGQIELSQLVVHPTTPDGVDRRFVGAYATDDAFHVYGQEQGDLGEWTFPTNDDVGGNVTFVPYPAPSSCIELTALAVHQGLDQIARFAATCRTSDSRAILFGGVSTGATLDFALPPVALEGDEPPPQSQVRAYVKLGDEHIVITGNDSFGDARPFMRRGASAAELTTATPMGVPEEESSLFFVGPIVEGRAMIGMLHGDPDTVFNPESGAAYETGLVGPAELDAFVNDPIATLEGSFAFGTLENVAPIFQIRTGDLGFIAGAVSRFQDSAPMRMRHYLWDEEARPRVIGFEVFEAVPPVQPLVGTTTRAGFGSMLSVWSEEISGAFRVRASRVQCLTQ